MRTLFVSTRMAFLTASLLATEVGRIPSAEGIKAADENFINVYQPDTDQALFFDRLRKHELQKLISNCGAAASTDLPAHRRTDTNLTLVTNNLREIPVLVRHNSHYNTIAGLRHLRDQLLACAFAAIDSDTKSRLFLAYRRLSAGIKGLDCAMGNYYGHLHLKDDP
jgi:hypothetical protein